MALGIKLNAAILTALLIFGGLQSVQAAGTDRVIMNGTPGLY